MLVGGSGLGTMTWYGAGLVALATVTGAAVSTVGRGRRRAGSLAVVSGILLAVVGADLVPDAWHDLAAAGMPWWTAVLASMAGWFGAGRMVGRGCACGSADGPSSTAAIGVHRALEGAVLAAVASVPVVLALIVHAGSEGFAMAELLGPAGRRRAATWLGVACVAPVVGAASLQAVSLPAAAAPLLTSVVAGVLLRIALVAYTGSRTAERSAAAGATVAGVGAALAVALVLL